MDYLLELVGKVACFAGLLVTLNAFSATKEVVPMFMIEKQGLGKKLGTLTIEDGICGVSIKPDLQGLPPGPHGFHIHQYASCADMGKAAGGHLDPKNTGAHKGPYHDGHLGDLPVLLVSSDGSANLPTGAPNFQLAQVRQHAIIIHAGGDNYADKPQKLGGSGERIACGVIGQK